MNETHSPTTPGNASKCLGACPKTERGSIDSHAQVLHPVASHFHTTFSTESAHSCSPSHAAGRKVPSAFVCFEWTLHTSDQLFVTPQRAMKPSIARITAARNWTLATWITLCIRSTNSTIFLSIVRCSAKHRAGFCCANTPTSVAKRQSKKCCRSSSLHEELGRFSEQRSQSAPHGPQPLCGPGPRRSRIALSSQPGAPPPCGCWGGP